MDRTKKFINRISELGLPYCSDCKSRFMHCINGTAILYFAHQQIGKVKCLISDGKGGTMFTPEFKEIYNKLAKDYNLGPF